MTNPTGLERAECSLKVEGIRPQRFVCHDDRWHYGDNACYRATRAEAANPTERPEERDSLALIEALRLETEHCEAARAEVKELREELFVAKEVRHFFFKRSEQMEEALRDRDRRLEQMGDALRAIRDMDFRGNRHPSSDMAACAIASHAHDNAALSPSDTERPLRQSNEPTPAHEWEDFE